MQPMKSIYLFCTLMLGLLCFSPAAQAAASAARVAPTAVVEQAAAEETTLTKKELRKERKAFKKDLKAKLKELRASDDLLLLIIIAILLPPLAMFLYEGSATNRFWLSLVLTLLFYVPGLVYTLYVILSEN
jgi:uncharacterized membrane protein YqaE (UPF0057 family)